MMKVWFTIFGRMLLILGGSIALIPLMDLWMKFCLQHKFSAYEFLAGPALALLLIVPTIGAITYHKLEREREGS
jgi:hypothetical protein